MKKFLTKAVILLLTVTFAVSLSGCGLFDLIFGFVDGMGTDSITMSLEESQEKIKTLGNTTGFVITFGYSDEDSEAGTITFGKKGDVIWVLENGATEEETTGQAYVQDGDDVNHFSYGEGEWTYTYTDEDTTVDNVYSFEGVATWLNYGHMYSGMLKKGKDKTVCGRSCETYTFNYSMFKAFGGPSIEYEVAVDKEYGITMLFILTGEAGGEEETIDYRVTSFNDEDVVAPRLVKPEVPSEE